jgi:hypothetical protein
MGVLLVTCPVTGKEFSTGLLIDKDSLPALPGVESSAHCPTAKRSTSGTHARRGMSMRYRLKIGSRTRIDARTGSPPGLLAVSELTPADSSTP